MPKLLVEVAGEELALVCSLGVGKNSWGVHSDSRRVGVGVGLGRGVV